MNMHAKDVRPDDRRVVPQGYGSADELVAIRTLMRLRRHEEALERFERWMDRNQFAWRTLA